MNNQEVDQLTARAIQAHAVGNYQLALEDRQRAAELAGMSDERYGGIMTTIGATYDRQGQPQRALDAVSEGYRILQTQARENGPDSIAARELPVAALYMGTLSLKQGMHEEISGKVEDGAELIGIGRGYTEEAWKRVQKIRKASPKRMHQHEINFSRRVSIARSLDGEPRSGAKLALGAAGLALFSESPRALVDQTSNLNFSGKVKAKTKALSGAAMAGVVAALSLSARTRRQALGVARKAL